MAGDLLEGDGLVARLDLLAPSSRSSGGRLTHEGTTMNARCPSYRDDGDHEAARSSGRAICPTCKGRFDSVPAGPSARPSARPRQRVLTNDLFGVLTVFLCVTFVCGCPRQTGPVAYQISPDASVDSVPEGEAIAEIATDWETTCSLNKSGDVSCWGNCWGCRRHQFQREPRLIPELTKATHIAVGRDDVCAVTRSGEVRCRAALKAHSEGDETHPILVPELPPVVDVSMSAEEICVLSSDGAVLCWPNRRRQKSTERVTANVIAEISAKSISTGTGVSCAVLKKGGVTCWGRGFKAERYVKAKGPDRVRGLGGAVALSVGVRNACAVLESGHVTCWGRPASHLGRGYWGFHNPEPPEKLPWINDAVQVATGADHACVLRRSGELACWGENDNGELGLEPSEGWSIPRPVPTVSSTVGITAGETHTCALSQAGVVRCWGGDYGRNSGTEEARQEKSTTKRPSPEPPKAHRMKVSAGERHTCAVTPTKEVACWGYGREGQLGIAESGTRPSPKLVPGVHDVVQIAAASTYTCVLHTSGSVTCWGTHEMRPQSHPYTPRPVTVKNIDDAQWIAAAGHHGCSVTKVGSVVCWDINASNYGIAAAWIEGIEDAKQVAMNPASTCVLRRENKVSCFETPLISALLHAVHGALSEEYEPSEPSPRPWPEPFTERVVSIYAGGESPGSLQARHTTCLLFASGRVSCMGHVRGDGRFEDESGPHDVIGLHDTRDLAVGVQHACAVRRSGQLLCWGYNRERQAGSDKASRFHIPFPVPGTDDVVSISAGLQHTCFARQDESLSCFGSSEFGQLGEATAKMSARPVPVTL